MNIRQVYRFVLPWVIIICLTGVFACAPAGIVSPLKKGEHAVSAHLGGPMIQFAGVPMPVPLSGVEYYYGLSNRISLTGGAGLTALSFGTGQISAGLITSILPVDESRRTGISAFGKAHFFLDHWQGNFRFYPETGIHVFHDIGKHRFYTGGSAWFETRFPSAARTSGNLWVPMIHAGWQKAAGKWQPSIELKWIAPNLSSEHLVVDYIGAGNRGTFGLYFGILRKF
jgi:hypothetical protein